MPHYDLIIRDVQVVRHDRGEPERADIGITGDRIAAVAPGLPATDADDVFDGGGKLAFPGVGRRAPALGHLQPAAEDDVETESRASRAGRRHHRR